jgi:Txe/YoeB family toxin of Txe-Axe toxin-antitoxin module
MRTLRINSPHTNNRSTNATKDALEYLSNQASPVPGMVSFSVISEEESTEEIPPNSPALDQNSNQPSALKPTHAAQIQLANNITSAAENTDVSNISSRIANLSMIGPDSVASKDEGDLDEEEFEKMLKETQVDGLPSPSTTQKTLQKMRSGIAEVNARTKGMDFLAQMKDNQGKLLQGQVTLQEGMDKILEHIRQNDPTYKAKLEKAEAHLRQEMARRVNAEKRANTLEELLEKERKGKVQLNRKPSAVLSDKTNAAGIVPPLTKVQIKAEAENQVRLQPETQEKAATRRSVRGPMGRGRRR